MRAPQTLIDILIILVLIAIGMGVEASGVFYQTGSQFYETCWQKMHSNGKEASTPQQAAQWASCDKTTDAALFEAGFIFGGNTEDAVTPQMKAMFAACPNSFSEVPSEGPWILAVDLIEKSGGPTLNDRFSPARVAIVRVFRNRWPACVTTARANGFPRIVKKVNGVWVFESECLPCRAEIQAMTR